MRQVWHNIANSLFFVQRLNFTVVHTKRWTFYCDSMSLYSPINNLLISDYEDIENNNADLCVCFTRAEHAAALLLDLMVLRLGTLECSALANAFSIKIIVIVARTIVLFSILVRFTAKKIKLDETIGQDNLYNLSKAEKFN